jgi:hypothetical protein
MIADTDDGLCAITEAQALLSLVADKLRADDLPADELFTLHVAVRVAMDRLDGCVDLLFAADEAAARGVVQ